MVKLVAVENYTGHTAMDTKGNKLVDGEIAEIYDMKVIPSADFDSYKDCFTSAHNSNPGIPERN